MNFTDNNPFRVLGLPLTASAKEIARQVNNLATYAEMGRSKSLDEDFSFLPRMDRTPEVIEEARKKIEQTENRFLHSLFWFWKNNSVDELAWEVLKDGKTERAIEIWENAVFANKTKAYKSVALYDNLIRQSLDWLETDDDRHSLEKDGEAYVIARKTAASYSIPTVLTTLTNDETDWSIECNTEWIEGVDSQGYGIVFGKDKGSYFTFELAASGHYRFEKYVDWKVTSLIPWKLSDNIDKWGTNHLKITNKNRELGLYISGKFVDSVRIVDSVGRKPFFGNYVGFKLTNAQWVVFSDLKVCRLVEDDKYAAGVNTSTNNFSNIKNLSLLFLSLAGGNGSRLRHDYLRKGLALANKCFSVPYIEEYARAVAGDRYVYDPGQVLPFYLAHVIDSLEPHLDKPAGISTRELVQTILDYPIEARKFINDRFFAKKVTQGIEKEIASAKAIRRASPSSAVDAGKTLIQATKPTIEFLHATFGKSDYQYQNIADKLALEVIQCGIDFFNATNNNEPGLPLYEYGSLVAVSQNTQGRAKVNLDLCRGWIEKNLCWFCGKNQHNSKCSYSKTIYQETSRRRFPRSVRFSYVDISIPRCPDCLEVQNKTPDNYWPTFIVTFSAGLMIGIIVGAIIDNIPAFGVGDGSGTIVGGMFGALAGGVIGGMIGERLKRSQLTKAGVKNTRIPTISEYPVIRQRLNEGWQFSKPTA